MAKKDGTVGISATIKKSQYNKILKLVEKSNTIKTPSAAFQYILDTFFNEDHSIKSLLIRYLLYPCLLEALALFGAYSTGIVNNTLLAEGLYFNELYALRSAFYIVSFGCLTWIAINMYLMMQKLKKEK